MDPVLNATQPHTTYLIGRLDRIIRRALEERLREFDLTVLMYTSLTVLAARPGLSNAQLARRSFMSPQGMNQALNLLSDRGLIERTPAADNRRVRQIALTDTGRQVVDKCTARVETYEQQLLASLDPAERSQLNNLLHNLVNENRRR